MRRREHTRRRRTGAHLNVTPSPCGKRDIAHLRTLWKLSRGPVGLFHEWCARFPGQTRRAGDKKRGRDGTKYSRTRPTSFLTHHMRQISSAAVITDACNIEKEIIGLKISQAPRGA